MPRGTVKNASNSIQVMSSSEQIEYASRVLICPDHQHIDINVDVATKKLCHRMQPQRQATRIQKPAANQA